MPSFSPDPIGQLVDQRDRQRPPLHDHLGGALVALGQHARMLGHQHAEIDQQAAIAILGKRGQPVQIRDLDAGVLERLDQRVGEPLRELVERHQARREAVAARRRGGGRRRRD